MILQHAIALGKHSSSLPHIAISVTSQFVENNTFLAYGLPFFLGISGVLIIMCFCDMFLGFYLPSISCGWVPIPTFL
jgi:hypothetical protein